MAKTSYVDIISELEPTYFAGLRPGDRYTFSRVVKKNIFISRKSKKGISAKSLLPEISVAWANLTQNQKDLWALCGGVSNLNGWRFFVQDYCARKVNGLSVPGTPIYEAQCWVGKMHIEAPADELKIVQLHPHFYYIYRKITGTKSMYAPVLINEAISMPFQFRFTYKSDLESVGAGSFAKAYIEFWYSYQGRNLTHELEINIDLQSDWAQWTNAIEELKTIIVGYKIVIHLYKVRGDLWFDNVKAIHSGQNWVRDWTCKDINQGFTRNYYQIPKHWTAEIAPEGSLFESVYLDL